MEEQTWKQSLNLNETKDKLNTLRKSLNEGNMKKTEKLFRKLRSDEISALIEHMKQQGVMKNDGEIKSLKLLLETYHWYSKYAPKDYKRRSKKVKNFHGLFKDVDQFYEEVPRYPDIIQEQNNMTVKKIMRNRNKSPRKSSTNSEKPIKMNLVESKISPPPKPEVKADDTSDTETNEEWEKSAVMLKTMMDKLLSGFEFKGTSKSKTSKTIQDKSESPKKISNAAKENYLTKVVTNSPTSGVKKPLTAKTMYRSVENSYIPKTGPTEYASKMAKKVVTKNSTTKKIPTTTVKKILTNKPAYVKKTVSLAKTNVKALKKNSKSNTKLLEKIPEKKMTNTLPKLPISKKISKIQPESIKRIQSIQKHSEGAALKKASKTGTELLKKTTEKMMTSKKSSPLKKISPTKPGKTMKSVHERPKDLKPTIEKLPISLTKKMTDQEVVNKKLANAKKILKTNK